MHPVPRIVVPPPSSLQNKMLKLHETVHTHNCSQCSYQTESVFQLNNHVQRSHRNVHAAALYHAVVKPEQFSCINCNYKSYYRFELYEHYKQIHNMGTGYNENGNFCKETARYACGYCRYESVSSLFLAKHHGLCRQELQETSENSSHRAKEKSYLRKHRLKHAKNEEVEWFPCSNCSYRAKQKSNLEVHMLKHAINEEIEWFQCNHCSHRAKTKACLRRHVMNRHATNVNVPSIITNSVHELLLKPFWQRTFDERLQIKAMGRPTPDLTLSEEGTSKGKRFKRTFNNVLYTEASWLCGCPIKNAVFCFPCLLFKGEETWSKTGVRNLGHVKEYIRRHSCNKTHIRNVLNLCNVGTVNIATQLDNAHHLAIKKHNEGVEKNRYVLSKIIDCIRFCGSFESAARDHDESETPENPGLVNLMASVDSAIQKHTEGNSIFKGTSKTIQNELLDCMLEVCREEIKKQVQAAKFIAVMADDTTDVSEKPQTVLVLRYEYCGEVHERFWGFLNPNGQNADALSACLISELQSVIPNRDSDKVIAQSYDGAAVMIGVQAKMKQNYKFARFIHCYAHQLDLVLIQSASQNKSVNVFFSNISGLADFFSRSPLRVAALEETVARRIPQVSNDTRWNSKSRVVNLMYENRNSLMQCFKKLQNIGNSETICKATGFRLCLEDEEFQFWLNFFHRIMPHVDILSNQVHSRQIDSVRIKSSIETFKSVVTKLRNDTASEEPHLSDILNPITQDSLKRKAIEACDVMMKQVENRFQSTEIFDVSKLLDCSHFPNFCAAFPENELNIAVKAYPVLRKNKLKTELTVLYERDDFRNLNGASRLLNFIISNNIEDTFEELAKLLRILITTPITTSEAERCFPTLKRIKTFLRNTMSQDRLNALAMLSMEKKLIGTDDFNTRVIDKFVGAKNRRMEFIYRR